MISQIPNFSPEKTHSHWCGFTENLSIGNASNNHTFARHTELASTPQFNLLVFVHTFVSTTHFNIELFTVGFLGLAAMIANSGLLYLARLTRPTGHMSHSSFSFHNSSLKSASFLKSTNKSKISPWLDCNKSSIVKMNGGMDADDNQENRTVLRKCMSSVSLCKLVLTSPGSSPTANHNPRSKRHKRYLRGLLGLSISNLTVAFSLILWCGLRIAERMQKLSWIPLILVFNNAIADVAQSLEIGAVLWIALERTMGIHFRSERRPSKSDVNCTAETIRPNACCGVCNLKLRSYMSKLSPCSYCCSDWMQCTYSWSANLLRRLRNSIHILLSLLPFSLFAIACVPNFAHFICHINQWKRENADSRQSFIPDSHASLITENNSNQSKPIKQNVNILYYTNSLVVALIIGQFLAPLTILTLTNFFIYKKVASRDKRFFSRQSSNTSKSSATMTTISLAPVKPSPPKHMNMGMVPLLRVLESSSQDLRGSDAKLSPMHNSEPTAPESSPMLLQTDKSDMAETEKLLLQVPMSEDRKDSQADNQYTTMKTHPLNQRRRSTSALVLDSQTGSFCLRNCTDNLAKQQSNRRMTIVIPQTLRKSTNDLLNSLFQGRINESNMISKTADDTLLVQMLRRQHRRTMRILIILLLVFVICRAPRAILLLVGWIQPLSLCSDIPLAHSWLLYTTLWTHTSAIFDTIVYGFWGNRTYRIHMQTLCSQYRLCCR